MHFQYSVRIAAFVCTVCYICGGMPASLGGDHSADGAQVEIWLGNERVQRPRLNRMSPPKSTNSNVEPNDRVGRALETERNPEDRVKPQGTDPVETVDAGRAERQTDTSAAFSPCQSFIQPLDPPERPRPAVHADQLGQARILLMQSIELARQADAILGETAIPNAETQFELDAQSPPASPARERETTEEPSKSPAESLGKTTAAERSISAEQGIPQQIEASNSVALVSAPAMIPSTRATPPNPSISGLTRPAGHVISPLVVRSLEAGGPGEKSAPRASGSPAPRQRAMSRTQQATVVALPQLDAKAIGVLVGLLLAVLIVLEFGGRLRSRIGVDLAGLWQRLSRRCVTPVLIVLEFGGRLRSRIGGELAGLWQHLSRRRVAPTARNKRLSPVDSGNLELEQELLAAVVAHNLRIRTQISWIH